MHYDVADLRSHGCNTKCRTKALLHLATKTANLGLVQKRVNLGLGLSYNIDCWF